MGLGMGLEQQRRFSPSASGALLCCHAGAEGATTVCFVGFVPPSHSSLTRKPGLCAEIPFKPCTGAVQPLRV